MDLPENTDSELTLWNKLLTNLGGTAQPDVRSALVALLNLLTA